MSEKNSSWRDYRTEFNERGSTELSPFLSTGLAEELYHYLSTEMPNDWWFVSMLPGDDAGQRVDVRMLPGSEQEILYGVSQATRAFTADKFSHVFYRTFTHMQGCACLVCIAIGYLQSPETVNLIRQVTGRSVTYGSAFFASCYTAGTFLSPHTDATNGEVGIVVQLSKGWRPQYGGLLNLLTPDSGRVARTVMPRFNSAFIFDIPQPGGLPHFVSHVAPGVTSKRLALSGWYA
jgi:SM-20-related protein